MPITTTTQSCGGVPGTAVPNSTYGWGRIDVKAAVDLIWQAGTLGGTVTVPGTSQPISSAQVSISRNGTTLTQHTATDGGYSFVAGAGTYQLAAEAFGYAAQTVTEVVVSLDMTTTQDFALDSLAVGSISGRVLESTAEVETPVAGATVALAGSPPPMSATTAADGRYTLAGVPLGTYSVRMTARGYQTLSADVAVAGAEALDFTPVAVPDYVAGDGGDTCSAEYAWLDATGGTAHNLSDDSFVSVGLPWWFTFYGNAYNTVYVSSNGFVSFGQGSSRWHGILPFEGAPNDQIVGLGEDLNPNNGTQGKIYAQNMGDGRFVIEYHAVEHWANGNPETFEIILNNTDDTILVQYQTVSWPDFANAGIENADGSRGILYSYANDPPLTTGLAVKYTPFSGRAPVCTPAAAPAVGASRDLADVVLRWQHVPPNEKYEIWTATDPYFDPPEGTPLDTLAATPGAMTYPDHGSSGDPLVNHFYLVRGVIAGGASGPSNRVGEFDYQLVPGN